jgi:lysophospholipase L1-like esterase
MKKILCFGDSLTRGLPGVTYLKHDKNKNQYINFGLCGDTVIGMTERLIKTIKKDKYKDATDIIVGIGANDILLPFLKGYTAAWQKRVNSLNRKGSVPCIDEKQFLTEYTKLIKILKEININVIIFGIPYIESSNFKLNDKVDSYNKIINNLCKQNNISYIDFKSIQKELKSELNNKGSYFISENRVRIIIDTLLTSFFPFASYISEKRGLALTIDGCHLNNVSSKVLAEEIEKVLNKNSRL